jgi:uncharacterized membrane protein
MTNDDYNHFTRAYEVSQGKFFTSPDNFEAAKQEFPGLEKVSVAFDSCWATDENGEHNVKDWECKGNVLPKSIHDAYHFFEQGSPSHTDGPYDFARADEGKQLHLDASELAFYPTRQTSTYSPVPYIPVSVVMAVMKPFNPTIYQMLIASRIAILLLSVLLATVALGILRSVEVKSGVKIPVVSALVGVILLFPMFWQQSASITADAMANWCVVIAIALIVKLRTDIHNSKIFTIQGHALAEKEQAEYNSNELDNTTDTENVASGIHGADEGQVRMAAAAGGKNRVSREAHQKVGWLLSNLTTLFRAPLALLIGALIIAVLSKPAMFAFALLIFALPKESLGFTTTPDKTDEDKSALRKWQARALLTKTGLFLVPFVVNEIWSKLYERLVESQFAPYDTYGAVATPHLRLLHEAPSEFLALFWNQLAAYFQGATDFSNVKEQFTHSTYGIIAAFGPNDVLLAPGKTIFYFGFLAVVIGCAIFFFHKNQNLRGAPLPLVAIITVGFYLGNLFIIWFINTPPQANAIGGFQGRYLLVLLPLLMVTSLRRIGGDKKLTQQNNQTAFNIAATSITIIAYIILITLYINSFSAIYDAFYR